MTNGSEMKEWESITFSFLAFPPGLSQEPTEGGSLVSHFTL